ncbi:UbiA prenyltransferase family protein [Kiritimatiellota bacterium B12222]|nr:UbiA prenyltransferase family protein [Kiritimatiellota bacterium B12222]
MNLLPYIDIARPSHWIKNIFILPGILLVGYFDPSALNFSILGNLMLAFAAACLIASSNYVINEILDAEKDKHHPEKKHRPIPSGQVNIRLAYLEWLVLAVLGLLLAFWVQPLLGFSALMLWVMGLIYNVEPLRMKDVAYGDVICESINNPIRMAMGWYATGFLAMPPLSVLMAYWMFGAFLMAMKRFAEYRMINDPERASRYRKSFGQYTEEKLLESIFFYGAFFGMLSGIFMARYQVELVLATPVVAYTMAYYMHLGFKPNSPVQFPEILWKQKKLMALSLLSFGLCSVLLFWDLPAFTDLFHPWISPQ